MANGLVLTYKVLEQGSFAWPKVQDGTMRLSRAQFEAEGICHPNPRPITFQGFMRLYTSGKLPLV